MGCCASSDDSPVPERRVFKVALVDAQDNITTHGVLTVTAERLELKVDGADSSAIWELKYLRRFGFDKQSFSFEAGRRCTDGPGIWAMSTKQAKPLFKMVDYYINRARQEEAPPAAAASPQASAQAPAQQPPKKLAYAQLDLSSKSGFKMPGVASSSSSAPKGKGKATSYAELDFDKMDEIAGDARGAPL